MYLMKIIYLKTLSLWKNSLPGREIYPGTGEAGNPLPPHIHTTGDRLTAASTQGGDLGFERERQTAQGKGQKIVHLYP